jgi:TolB-like protein
MTKRLSIRVFLALISVILILPSITDTPAYGQKPPRVAVFPFQFYAKESLDYLQDAIFVSISGRITEEGDVAVIERGTLQKALSGSQGSELNETVVQKTASDLGADYAITGTLSKVGELVSLDARLISIARPGPPLGVSSQYRGLEAAMEGLGEFAVRIRRRIVLATATPREEKEKPSEESTITSLYEKVVEGVRGEEPTPPQPGQGFETLHALPTFLRGVGVGDVDGDGKNEIVLIDKRTLWVYKQAGSRLRLFRKIEGHRNDDFLTLDVADLNRNGFSEIVVSNLRAGVLRSFILEFEENRLKKITDRERWFFRLIEHPGRNLTLVGQKMGPNRHPMGGIFPFAWTGKKFHPEKTPLTKREIPVFGFNLGDVDGQGESSILFMDYHDRLHVRNRDGAYRWESTSPYGGSDIFYPIGSQGSTVGETRVYLPARLLIRDLDEDGTAEVIVSRNTFKLNMVERLRIYDRARLVNLSWRGVGLTENWETPEIPGYISDYQIIDVDNDGKDEIVLTAVSKATLRKGASSALLLYEIF